LRRDSPATSPVVDTLMIPTGSAIQAAEHTLAIGLVILAGPWCRPEFLAVVSEEVGNRLCAE
jgi:hypothetical protein